MLPVGGRPVIDYVVEDCVKAGITDIYFVVGEQSEQMRRYYGDNAPLYRFLEDRGKLKELEELRKIGHQANFHFIVQKSDMPYGTAVPALLCEQYLEPGEQILVVSGDQFVYNESGESEAARLLREVEGAGATTGMAVVNVPQDEVSKYGIVEVEQRGKRQIFKRIIEKPKPEEAPTTLNNLCIYLFDDELFECARQVMPTNGEYYLTDALNIYVQKRGRELPVVTTSGRYMDIGTIDNWLKVNQFMLREVDE